MGRQPGLSIVGVPGTSVGQAWTNVGRAPGTQDYVSGNNVPGSIFGDFELDGSTDDAYTFIDPEYVPFRLGNKSQISVGACTGSQLCLAIEPPPGPPDSGFQVLVLDFDLPR